MSLVVANSMSTSRILRSLVILAGAAVLFTGCATSNPGPQTDEAFAKSMSEAEAAAKGGQQDKAIDLYQQIAKANPTRDDPWVRIAQIQFGSEKYPQAILAAEEALQNQSSDLDLARAPCSRPSSNRPSRSPSAASSSAVLRQPLKPPPTVPPAHRPPRRRLPATVVAAQTRSARCVDRPLPLRMSGGT
jgi:tetratricopeptide (TPR) repeat protein